MDKKTYECLHNVLTLVEAELSERHADPSYANDVLRLRGWMEEVAKDYVSEED
jgi:hypothetical protein